MRRQLPPTGGRPNCGRLRKYTRKTAVETTSYDEGEVSEQHQGAVREGVRHVEVDEEHAGQRLDNFLMRQLQSVPRSRIYRLVRRGEVRVNGRRASPEDRLHAHDTVRIPPVNVQPQTSPGRVPPHLLERVGQSIVQEDERLIVLNKPAGIAVHGGSGVSFGVIEALRALRPDETLELVHRLDRDTSGCLLVARKPSSLRVLHALLREGQFEKGYLALVKGKWNLGRKRMDIPLRTDLRVGGERTVRADASGKEAISDFRPVQFFGNVASLLEVSIHTGRTHQIRVHAAHAGHPVAGDDKYGDKAFNAQLQELTGLDRMFLHAHSVSFTWPQGAEVSVNTPLPDELGTVLDRLGHVPKKKTRSRR
jgi:23S rRNA pseudouridine955/2504/2580 synthase